VRPGSEEWDALVLRGAIRSRVETARAHEQWSVLPAYFHWASGWRAAADSRAAAIGHEHAQVTIECWWDGDRGYAVRTTLGELMTLLESSSLHPEGELRAVSSDGSWWIRAYRGQWALKIELWSRD